MRREIENLSLEFPANDYLQLNFKIEKLITTAFILLAGVHLVVRPKKLLRRKKNL